MIPTLAITVVLLGPAVEPELRAATGPEAVAAPEGAQMAPVELSSAQPSPSPSVGPAANKAEPVATEAEPAEDAVQPADEPKRKGPSFAAGVQVFLRGEGRFEPDFGAGTTPDAAVILERARLQLGATWGPMRAFVQGQDARVWGFEASTTSNEANTDLHQGYLDLFGEKNVLSGQVRLGRQEVIWGKQRLIGNLTWLPGARSFDALRLTGKASVVELDMFAALLAPRGTVVDDSVDPAVSAVSNGAQLLAARLALDAHAAFKAEALGLAVFEDAKDGALAFERRIANVGLRVWGEPVAGLTYDVEGNGQLGRFAGLTHRAWAFAGNVGYMHGTHRVKPGGHLGYAMGSGHRCTAAPSMARDNCGSGQSNDFFNFYPTNHIHYGIADQMNWANMRDLEAAAKLGFDKLVTAVVAYHYFQLHEPAGRWTNAGGALVGAGWDPANQDRNLGHEIDVFATIKPWAPLMIQPGYAVFIPTTTLAGTTPQHFAFLWLVGTFEKDTI